MGPPLRTTHGQALTFAWHKRGPFGQKLDGNGQHEGIPQCLESWSCHVQIRIGQVLLYPCTRENSLPQPCTLRETPVLLQGLGSWA